MKFSRALAVLAIVFSASACTKSASTSEDAPMQELQKAWLASDWANQIPVGVEVGFETVAS